MKGEHDGTCQGIDVETWEFLNAQLTGDIFDVYSAVCRPGAWEWPTSQGEAMRSELHRRGYRATTDPVASWRVWWVKDSPHDIEAGVSS